MPYLGLQMNSSRPRALSAKHAAFTLVEVTISLGIVAFAMVSLVGMLPAGLSNFRTAMATTIEAQIVQALTDDILVTDFSNLSKLTNQEYTYDSRGVATVSGDAGTVYTAKITLQPLDDLHSYPVNLTLQPKNAPQQDEAYNVQIEISRKNQPNQPGKYSLIVANDTGRATP